MLLGTLRAFFKGNGANVVKIAPETALKLTFNDKMKALLVADPHDITPLERMAAGALAGASAQVRLPSILLSGSLAPYLSLSELLSLPCCWLCRCL